MDSGVEAPTTLMPPPKGKPRAHGDKSVDRREDSADVNPRQQSNNVVDSFAKSRSTESPKDCEAEVRGHPPKRQKKAHPTIPGENAGETTSSSEKMYSFANDLSNRAAVIDLTTLADEPPEKISKGFTSNGFRKPQAQIGTKRIVVKNLRKEQKSSPDDYLEQTWLQLDSALSAIFGGKEPSCSREELYKMVENVCRLDKAPLLYKKVCAKFRDHVMGPVRELLLQRMDEGGTAMLVATIDAWSTWSNQMTTVRSLLYYMDRTYLLHKDPDMTIQGVATAQFQNLLLSSRDVIERVLQDTTDLIDAARHGNHAIYDPVLLAKAVRMFHELSLYTKEFEPKMLVRSKAFYRKWADEMMKPNRIAPYVRQCQDLIHLELQRCDQLNYDAATTIQITALMDKTIIAEHASQLVDRDLLSPLLEADDRDSLHVLYILLRRKELCERLKDPFEAYITVQGSSIVFDEEKEQDMIIRLLTLKRKLDAIWESSFEKHESLGHGLREAFEGFINKTKKSNMTWGTDNPKPGEMIAKYVDMILKGGSRAIAIANGTELRGPEDEGNEDEMDEDAHINRELDQVLDMFRFVHGKAVFEAFYKRDLARRLLMGRSASADAEKSMLTRLRSECGSGFTHNLEQMFTDIELAREEIASYKQLLEDRHTKSSVDLSVNVLSSAAWPSYPDVAVDIPTNVQKATANFEAHYKAKHGGRRLQWKHGLAHCQIRGRFPKGDKEFVVSSFQAIVMLQFNDKPADQPLSYADIQAATNLPAAEINRTLQSLACAKYRVLKKQPKGREVSPTDTFTVNLAFEDPKYRIKINQVQLKETPQENKETHERVAADRHYETQAAIVRIMKGRKTMHHAELVAEVISATRSRGVLDPTEIKKEIGKLIEKDYLEREEGGAYTYLA